ncbi:MAG TPA: hypothetical protein VFZ31_09700 [Vicinamibacterales bacterium]
MALTSRALAFASRWFDDATVRHTLEPLIADWQREWHTAPPSRRAWTSVRGAAAFACAVVVLSPRILLTPTPRAIGSRVMTRIALFCLIVGGLLSIPILRSPDTRWVDTPLPVTLLLLALPVGIVMAFPFAMVIAVDAIRRSDAAANVERATVVKLAIAATLFMVLMQGVIAPFANQRWRELSTPPGWTTPPPSFGESSTWALLTHPERHTAMVPRNYTRAGEIRRQLMSRMVMSIVPALFVWLRWTALSHRRRFWPPPAGLMTVLVAVMFFGTAVLGFRLEYLFLLSPGTGAWLPVAVALLFGVAQQCVEPRRLDQANPAKT